METEIRIEGLQKRYGSREVLKGLTFSVAKGEIFALLGTNGAGKTTTLECIEGLRRYDGGSIQVRGSTGVQLQSATLPETIQVREAFTLFSKWKGVSNDRQLFQSLGLEELAKQQYRMLSTGQKRRLHLALALVGNPDILFLDEPTAGLDVEGRAALHSELRRLREQGKTLILASHDMAEVETLCDRLAILKDGVIAYLGTPAQLTARVGSACRLLLKLSGPLALPFGEAEERQGYLAYQVPSLEEGLRQVLSAAETQKIQIQDLRVEHASLEERFLEIAKEAVS